MENVGRFLDGNGKIRWREELNKYLVAFSFANHAHVPMVELVGLKYIMPTRGTMPV